MKHSLCFLLTLSISLMLFSCAIQNPAESSTTTENTARSPQNSEIHGWSIDDYDEYLTRLNEAPTYFITYDKISNFGAFRSFNGAYGIASIENYGYSLEYNGYPFILEIHHFTSEPLIDQELRRIDEHLGEDMRFSTVQEAVYDMPSEEIVYVYYGGSLDYIAWNCGNTRFQLYSENGFASFPRDEQNLLSRLLNKSTALEAKAEFDALISGE